MTIDWLVLIATFLLSGAIGGWVGFKAGQKDVINKMKALREEFLSAETITKWLDNEFKEGK